MIEEERQSEEALRVVQSLLRQGSDSFHQPAFSSRTAGDLAKAIEILVDRRVAVRERQILEALRQMLEAGDEPA